MTDANRLSLCHPDVAADWDYEKNFPFTPDQFSISSSRQKRWWKCPEGHNSYEALISTRTRSRYPAKCPECPRSQKLGTNVTNANRLSLLRPDLILSWNKERNLPLTPDLVSIASNKRIIWDCLNNPKHPSWPASVSDRAGSATREGTGCPNCYLVRTSRPELRLKAELSRFLTISPELNKIKVDGEGAKEVDIADHSVRLIVEFDGAYSHGLPGRLERDTVKTGHLREAGWAVVRVREHNLTKIDPVFDVTVGKDAHPYRVATTVITHLSNLGYIPADAAEDYRRAGCLQAKNLSDSWIIDRLGNPTSKAESDTFEDKWDRMYKILVSFHEYFGHCNIPYGILLKDVDLRTWCYTQRASFRKGTLSKERQKHLTAIPSWTFDVQSGRFWEGLDQYQYAFNWQGTGQRHPDADVRPARRWAQKLRERRRKLLNDGRDLPAYQIQAMDKIPGWCWTPRDSRFDEQIDVLSDYCRQLDTTLASIKDKDVWEGHKIGMWITNWRSSRPQLPVEQIKKLESLPGWTWSKNADAWNSKIAALAAFGEANGHLKPSLTLGDEHEHALAKWKHKYRSKLRGQDNERAQRLRALLAQYGEEWN
ncbi:Helicase associated domain protein [Streptosporangium sp. NPDC006007]|uniref:Helicase associated domain protein n=1 Tax=Streptosporangium sp. NPDC006007 TaxID=3154575 RepID=UPI0033A7CA60